MFHISGHTVWIWLAPLVLGGVVAAAATPLAIRLAQRLRVIDLPIGGKIHKRPIPLLGGLAVYAGFLAACVAFLPLRGPVLGILAGGAVAIGVGIADDKLSLPPLMHLAGQVLAAVTAITVGLGVVKRISNPLASAAAIAHARGDWHVPLVLGVLFTIFWIVGMMNTVNFLDGLDGLSSGVGVIAAVTLAWWAANPPFPHSQAATTFGHAPLVLPAVLIGSLLGFLPFNWRPARIFIGDSGAMFLGLALAALSILGPAKIGTALLVLSIPVLDVAWAIVRRQLRGKSFLAGDKQHVYHRMVELGMSHTGTVLSLYALCAGLAYIDLSAQKLDKLIAFTVVAALVGTGCVLLELLGSRREQRTLRRKTATEPG